MGAEPNGRPKAVDSYEGESAVVLLLIRPNELAVHESRIGVEVERLRRTGGSVGAGPTEIEIDLTDDSFKMCDRGRIAAIRMGAGRICREGHACYRTREKEVCRGRRRYVRDRKR